MRKGRRLAIDVGKARIGLAISDQDGILATPLATVNRLDDLADSARAVAAQVADYVLLESYVGLPLNLQGLFTPSTQDAIDVAHALQAVLECEIRFIDERMTTVTAAAQLRAAGKSAKTSRAVIDQAAAVIILEQALSFEKSSGQNPGTALAVYPGTQKGSDA
jgi:putative Holliday junction resolvase